MIQPQACPAVEFRKALFGKAIEMSQRSCIAMTIANAPGTTIQQHAKLTGLSPFTRHNAPAEIAHHTTCPNGASTRAS